MGIFRKNRDKRDGAVAPLFALLLIPLLGMMAFSIDVGWTTLARCDLQNAADAAVLAGAEKMQDLFVQYYLPANANNQSTILSNALGNAAGSPKATAKQFSAYNKAGNVSVVLRDQDVTFGFTDASGAYSSSYTGFPNTISVVARRDSLQNTPLGLFFGPVLGSKTVDLQATAKATIYSGDVSTLQVIPGVDAHILPVALDYTVWKTFYASGKSPDGTIHYAPADFKNQYPQLQVYPNNTNTPGSFGLIDVGPPSNNAPTFRNWISNGSTPNDIAYLTNPANNMLPVSLTGPKNWKVGPGLKDTLLSNFQGAIGQPNLIPLFAPAQTSPSYVAATGTGQNATYAVVGFVGVMISQATGNGSGGMNISIQPTAVVDPTSVITNPTPTGTTTSSFGTTTTTFISAKLTQ